MIFFLILHSKYLLKLTSTTRQRSGHSSVVALAVVGSIPAKNKHSYWPYRYPGLGVCVLCFRTPNAGEYPTGGRCVKRIFIKLNKSRDYTNVRVQSVCFFVTDIKYVMFKTLVKTSNGFWPKVGYYKYIVTLHNKTHKNYAIIVMTNIAVFRACCLFDISKI